VNLKLSSRIELTNWTTLVAVRLAPDPVLECQAGKGNAIACNGRNRGPVLIYVETVRVLMTNEVLEYDIFDVAISAIRLDHHFLVGILRIDVRVGDGRNGRACAERTNRTASTPIAVNVLNEVVGRRVLDRHAFIFIGDFDIVDVVVTPRNVDSVKSTSVSPTDDDIVYLLGG
jgi:hypothetical protein